MGGKEKPRKFNTYSAVWTVALFAKKKKKKKNQIREMLSCSMHDLTAPIINKKIRLEKYSGLYPIHFIFF